MKLKYKIIEQFKLISNQGFENYFDDYEYTYLVVDNDANTAYEVTDKEHIKDSPNIDWMKIDGDINLSDVLDYFVPKIN